MAAPKKLCDLAVPLAVESTVTTAAWAAFMLNKPVVTNPPIRSTNKAPIISPTILLCAYLTWRSRFITPIPYDTVLVLPL